MPGKSLAISLPALLAATNICAAGEALVIEFTSAALERQAKFSVFVPQGETPSEGWPVLYLLHGAYGQHTDWWSNTEVCKTAQELDVMVVFPDGGQFGWYMDSPASPEDRYETHVIDELIPLVDRTFRTRADRAHRGICGLSMGGHGAITLATKHPALFTSASSLSGILELSNHVKEWSERDLLGTLIDAPDYWAANSAFELAPRLVDADVRIFLDCGDSDETGATADNRVFHQRLEELSVEHRYVERPGGHSWEYWGENIAEHVRWHAEGFGE